MSRGLIEERDLEDHVGRRRVDDEDGPRLALFTEMKTAKSVGGFFSKNVKSKLKVVWDGFGCDSSPCQQDATLQAEVAGNKFRVCESCSKKPPFRLSLIL